MTVRSIDRQARLRRDAEAAAQRFPALLAQAEALAGGVVHGVHGRRRPGVGETFWEFRRHRPEDGPARVDWRRSARSDELYVREAEHEAANPVLFWRDGAPGMETGSGQSTKRERASVLLMALASLLARGGERLGVIGETGRARTGRAGLEACAYALADGPGEPRALEAADLPKRGVVVIASDFLDPPETWAKRLGAVRAAQAAGALVRIVDPAEEDFPFTGRTRFKPPQAGEALLFGKADDARAAYRERWTRHGADIAGLARRAGLTLITHRTDRPAASALLSLYEAISGALDEARA